MFTSSFDYILLVVVIALTSSASGYLVPGANLGSRNSLYESRRRIIQTLGAGRSPQNLESSQQRCRPVRLANGKSRSRQRGRFAIFMCNRGYELVGSRHAVCEAGKWDVETPVCVKTGCPPLEKPEHGVVHFLNNNAVGLLYCDPGYEIEESSMVYCNGQRWNGTIPKCTETYKQPELSCDFESADICGWTHDTAHDFDWRRQNYTTPSTFVGTGPQHDHTLGAGNGGHYMYIESSSRIENETARLFSPLYRGNHSDGCFVFFYHMYGKSIGSLRIYQKPEGATLTNMLDEPETYRLFEKYGNQGNAWYMGFFYLNSTTDNFQIVIEGVNGPSYASDIAIDDVGIFMEPMCSNISSLQENTVEEEGGFSDVQSCSGRCDTYGNASAVGPSVLACDCTLDCDETSSCCLDYLDVCVFESTVSTDLTVGTEDFEEFSTSYASTKIVYNSTMATSPTIRALPTTLTPPSTVQRTTPTTPRPSTKATDKMTTVTVSTRSPVTSAIITPVTKRPPPATRLTTYIPRIVRTTKSTTSVTSPVPVPTPVTKMSTKPSVNEIDAYDLTTMKQIDDADYSPVDPLEIETDFLGDETRDVHVQHNQHNQHIKEVPRSSVSWQALLFAAAGLLAAVALGAFAAWRYKRRSFRYKNTNARSRTAHRGANEEFSEVRFLTADEQLDFNMATPDGD